MIPCVHRKEVFEVVKNTLCGFRGTDTEIYRCSIFIFCTYRPYKHNQAERICLRCEDAQEPSEQQNSQG